MLPDIGLSTRRTGFVQEVRSSNALPPNYQPLPPIPARPTYPVEWLSDADTRQYLDPLYRRGWGIAKYRPKGETHIRYSQLLSKRYVFAGKGKAYTVAFAAEISRIANKLVVSLHVST